MENYYEQLRVSRYATTEEIKQATQQQIKLIKTAYATLSDDEKRADYEENSTEVDFYAILDADPSATTTRLKLTAQEKLAELKTIYNMLSDPEQRANYDADLSEDTDDFDTTDIDVSANNLAVDHDDPYAAPSIVVTDVLSNDGEMELASRFLRLVGYIVDGFIYALPTIPLIPMFVNMVTELDSAFPEGHFEESDIMAILLSELMSMYGIMAGLGILLIFIINLVLLYRSGQTIAKKMLRIKIVCKDYTRAGLLRIIFLRNLIIALISIIPVVGGLISLIGYLMIFGKSRRCLHDLIAGTVVVKA